MPTNLEVCDDAVLNTLVIEVGGEQGFCIRIANLSHVFAQKVIRLVRKVFIGPLVVSSNVHEVGKRLQSSLFFEEYRFAARLEQTLEISERNS